jgi:hypothetical protein
MGFSRAQQPLWQALKAAAWLARCKREGWPLTLKIDRDWYEQELFHATGKTSSTDCDAGRDYNLAMAHFEGLAGTGIRWQMRLYDQDVKRMMQVLRSDFRESDLKVAGVNEEYVLRCIRNGFGSKKPWQMTRAELTAVLTGLKRHVRHTKLTLDDKNAARGLWQENGEWRERDPEKEPF